jgi:hypothetical protein
MMQVRIFFFWYSSNNLGGRNVFESCVSRLVYLSGESDQILGYFNEKDERLRGLIDKFSQAINVSDV